MERPACLLVGKQEAPPESTVTESDVAAFYNYPGSIEKGSLTAAFRYEMHGDPHGNAQPFVAKPVIRGAEVAAFADTPPGMNRYTLDGGKYARVYETLPNGEYNWLFEHYVVGGDLERDTGLAPDLSRLFFVRQTGYGRQSELFVPVNGSGSDVPVGNTVKQSS